jgi:hypothetical protein
VKLDRAKAAELGVQVADVATTLQTMVAGREISTYAEGGEQYEVHARAVAGWRTNAEGLAQMAVPSSRLGAVSLDNVPGSRRARGPPGRSLGHGASDDHCQHPTIPAGRRRLQKRSKTSGSTYTYGTTDVP